jgi:hypothetical protein
MTKYLGALFLLLAAPVQAATTLLSPHVYMVDAGVDFTISHSGTSSYLFGWSDGSGTFTDIEDPSFVFMVGETYSFQRTTAGHPLALCDATLPVDGTDGSFFRTTTDVAVIDAATLTPAADFIADPAPTTDLITWTPGPLDLGNFYYTCRDGADVGMTGKTRVVEPAVPVAHMGWSAVKVRY